LVVEDDPDQLEVIRLYLKDADFAVSTAVNGIEALEKARSTQPELVVLDLLLPGLNGFDVCEALRKDPVTASVPIIMLTGWASQFGRIAGLEYGANDYITKPFALQELRSRVEGLLFRPGASAGAPGNSKPEPVGSRPEKDSAARLRTVGRRH